MHYGSNAFSANGKPTIVVKPTPARLKSSILRHRRGCPDQPCSLVCCLLLLLLMLFMLWSRMAAIVDLLCWCIVPKCRMVNWFPLGFFWLGLHPSTFEWERNEFGLCYIFSAFPTKSACSPSVCSILCWRLFFESFKGHFAHISCPSSQWFPCVCKCCKMRIFSTTNLFFLFQWPLQPLYGPCSQDRAEPQPLNPRFVYLELEFLVCVLCS